MRCDATRRVTPHFLFFSLSLSFFSLYLSSRSGTSYLIWGKESGDSLPTNAKTTVLDWQTISGHEEENRRTYIPRIGMYHASISGRRHASIHPSLLQFSLSPPTPVGRSSADISLSFSLYNENNTVALPPERTDKGCARDKTVVTVVVANLRRTLEARQSTPNAS